MEFCNIKFKKKEIFFWFAYILLIIYRVIKSTTIGFNDKGFMYIIIIGFFIINIVYQRVTINRMMSYGLLFILISLYVFKTKEPIIPIFILAIMSVKEIEFKKIVKVSFCLVLPIVVITVLLAMLGVIPDIVTYRNFGNKSVPCHGMGFNHSSALPTYFTFIFMEYFYLKKKEIKIIDLIIFVLGGYIIFLNCAERLRFYIIFIIVFLLLFKKSISKILFKIKENKSFLIFPIIAIISWTIGYIYNPKNSIFYLLNILLSNRLYFQNYAFNNLNISLFGHRIPMGEDAILINGNLSYFYLDSAYTYILFSYGVLFTFYILWIYSKGFKEAHSEKDYILWLWYFMLAIDSCVGNQFMSIWIIPIALYPFCKKNKKYITNI